MTRGTNKNVAETLFNTYVYFFRRYIDIFRLHYLRYDDVYHTPAEGVLKTSASAVCDTSARVLSARTGAHTRKGFISRTKTRAKGTREITMYVVVDMYRRIRTTISPRPNTGRDDDVLFSQRNRKEPREHILVIRSHTFFSV